MALLVVRNVPSYHPMKFLGKLMDQILKNNQKPNFGPDFGLFGPNSDHQILSAAFTSTSN